MHSANGGQTEKRRKKNTMSNQTETPTPEVNQLQALPELLTVDEVAELLRLNRKTVYAAIQRGEFPGARRIGATIRVSRDAMLQWFAGQVGVSPAEKGSAR
jgi:excisionase family DNA binding protein